MPTEYKPEFFIDKFEIHGQQKMSFFVLFVTLYELLVGNHDDLK